MTERQIYKDGTYSDDMCACGHTQEKHFINANSKKKPKAQWCGVEDRVNYLLHCECKDFTIDPLRHIEILEEEKALGFDWKRK